MNEIKTTGLKGLYNRINLFSKIQQEDVIDTTVFMNDIPNSSLATNRVMLVSRTESLIITGKDLSPDNFKNLISKYGGNEIDMEEYDAVKKLYRPEYNTGTNRIGKGSRKIGNIIMLLARAEYHIQYGHDFLLHEFTQMLLDNSVKKEDL